ncbi:23S rRNA (guanosine(2251)-2'-O)-methyltransferase RlmB [Larsenimonas rhizosphaerae]|uniref:23S rRNA (guanosine(2251)-2'-O)-methyltransferase RlmB n=1 Tax=Larsenimonas rhizosphaerae TaxID=2944682 RepID=UPI003D9CB4E1
MKQKPSKPYKGKKPSRSTGHQPEGLDPVFGLHAVQALLANQLPEKVWLQEGEAERRLAGLVDTLQERGVPIEFQPRQELDRLAGGASHQGVVAFCPPLASEGESRLYWEVEQAGNQGLWLVLDGVTDPHNLGACLRSADAAGVRGVILPRDKSAPLNGVVRKVACGAAEVMPVYQVVNLSRTLAKMKSLGVWIIGTSGDADKSIFDADFNAQVALVMGSEGRGMRRLTREACDHLVKLPMLGSVSSLNVSVATGICLFEAVRQQGISVS